MNTYQEVYFVKEIGLLFLYLHPNCHLFTPYW